MRPSGPVMRTRSVSRVSSPSGSITWSKLIRIPGERDSSTHMLGRSTRVTINLLRGKPLALLVMTAPTRNSPSICAESMWSYALQPPTSVHAAQADSALARATAEAS